MSPFSVLHALCAIVGSVSSTILLYTKQLFLLFYSRNSKLELELAQVRADFERLKSQDNTKSERLEELS